MDEIRNSICDRKTISRQIYAGEYENRDEGIDNITGTSDNEEQD